MSRSFPAAVLSLGLLCAPAVMAAPAAVIATAATPVVAAPAAPAEPAQPRRGGTFSIGVSLGGRLHAGKYDAFQVDSGGQQSASDLEAGSRFLLRLDADLANADKSLRMQLRVSSELAHGTFSKAHGIDGDKLPPVGFDKILPTEMYGALSLGKKVGLRVGQMTSNWGMGLLANDGLGFMDGRADDWFSLPQVGDRVNRALLWTRPWAGGSSALAGLAFFVAADRVVQDDIIDVTPGATPWLGDPNADQKAQQLTIAGRMYLHKKRWVGLYYVRRQQDHSDGKGLTANVLDIAADLDYRAKSGEGLHVTAEGVALFGSTTLGPSPDFPEHDIQQYALAARARYFTGKLRIELDGGMFTGDPSTDDGAVNNFKADPNYQQGLLLFRRVLAWQSGRARLTASNLDIVGKPNEDLDRLATSGSVTNAITLFPKVGYSPIDGLQVYGGVLLALTMADLVDPFHTRTLGGGEPRNYLAAKADGAMLGTEIDLGVSYRVDIFGKSSLWLRAEYGILMPGPALQGAADELGTITGGRISIATGPGRS